MKKIVTDLIPAGVGAWLTRILELFRNIVFFQSVFKTWVMPGTPGTPASFSEIPRFKNLTEVTLHAEMSMLDLIGTL